MDQCKMWRVLTTSVITLIQLGTETVASGQVCFVGTVHNNDVGSSRWFLPYDDPCVCNAVRLGGTMLYKPSTGHYLDGLFLSEDSAEIKTFFDCPGPTLYLPAAPRCDAPVRLGIEHGTPLNIPDENFRASSFDNGGSYQSTPSSARLNFAGGSQVSLTYSLVGGWKPDDCSSPCWIEVKLGKDEIITGVITQGRSSNDGKSNNNWVTQFRVKYSTIADPTLVYVTAHDGTRKTFGGNTDGDTEVTNNFWQPVLASTIRFRPVSWETQVVLRFELLGCL